MQKVYHEKYETHEFRRKSLNRDYSNRGTLVSDSPCIYFVCSVYFVVPLRSQKSELVPHQ
jgi:hypothetical protein